MAFKAIKLSKEQLAEYIKQSDKRGESDDRFFVALTSFGTMVRYYLATSDWSYKALGKNLKKEFVRSFGFSFMLILIVILALALPFIMLVDCSMKLIQLYKNRKDILTRNVFQDAGRRQVKRSLELYRKYSK